MLVTVSGTQEHQPPRAAGVEDTIKDFWATRPTRPRRGRKIAGVAAGIGNRYGIDPVIIRVAFVVATFYGGAGALFYLLGWLMLPEQDDEAAPLESMVGHGRSSMSGPFTVLLCLALVPAVWFFFDHGFGGFLGLLIVGGALFLLHRSRGHIGRPSTPPPPAPEVAYQPLTEPASSPPAASAEPPVAPSPPAWDPLGAAPFAWDLPEPSPPAPPPAPPPCRKSKVGLVTVAVALITAGSLALVAPYAGGWLSPQHIIGIVLGVLGLGMVWGSFVNGGRGLIGWAVPLAVVGVALTVVSPNGWHGVGELVERPVTAADVQPRYERSAGRIELDLRELPDEGSVHTAVSVGAGDIEVILPSHADVEVTCQANVGDVTCLGRNASGPDSEISVTEDGDSAAGGLRIELDVDAGVGHAEVRRG
jgi:phage shock protein PspC (stress-responsive transcriptional regulator)